ncbi:tail fiber domain-containing protein [Myxococcus sp. AM011]|uniref:tail fiber domain-containing protein n=2 Tax=Myxococcus TaxID=32 RepID=UPI0015959180|nr:tail fiber domain-containing protein [Myxococcus sp. AM011]NVJ27278.1 tail fiber domain-containing protein [Myxococcus sp. AM011]
MGLELKDNVLSLPYGSGANAPVPSGDPRLSDARQPLPGSANYIQNGVLAQEASFSLAGTGTTRGRMTTRSDVLVDATTAIATPTALLKLQNTASDGVNWTAFPLLTVDSAGGLLARGEQGQGTLPMSGTGTRLMWAPHKGAFRAGHAETQWDDSAIGLFSWAGGNLSSASGRASFSMGENCVASGGSAACIGNGSLASGPGSVSMGFSNSATGTSSTALGFSSIATGTGAIALGYRVTANSDYGIALGQRVSTDGRTGSFIWGDQSNSNVASNTANNQFMVRAAGGIRLRSSADLTTGCDLAAGSGAFNCTSDRNQKEGFRNVDGELLLTKVSELPISTWRYKQEQTGVLHMGPMAQDFRAAFGLGSGDTSIGMLDIDGVNLAAIKALEARTRELREKTAEVDTLKAELAELKRGLSRLEATVNAKAARP